MARQRTCTRSPLEEASRAFMAPLSHLMHPRSAALGTHLGARPLHRSVPYPRSNHCDNNRFVPLRTPAQSGCTHRINVDDLTRQEEEYFADLITPLDLRSRVYPHGTSWTALPDGYPLVPNFNRSIRIFSLVLEDTTSRAAPFPHPLPVGAHPLLAGLPAVGPPYPLPYVVPIAAAPATYVPAQWPPYQQTPWAPIAILSLPATWE